MMIRSAENSPPASSLPLAPVQEIVEEARNGRIFILVDHEDRENEGDLIIPAQMATPDAINFMATHGRGLICLAMTRARIETLGLKLVSPDNHSRHATAFTHSIEAREGVTTGISTHDRARTIAVAIDDARGKEAIVSPGHVFPLCAQEGGVLVRAGHTEAAVDIARLAGLNPSGVICEIMREDGKMARLPDLIPFARRHGLKIGTIADLIAYRRKYDNLVRQTAACVLNHPVGGEWQVRVYEDIIDGSEHMALTLGDVRGLTPVLVRVHVIDPLGDLLARNGAHPGAIMAAMRRIARDRRGALLLLQDMHRKNPVSRRLAPRMPAPPAALRHYGVGAQILCAIGVSNMRLISNSRRKIVGLDGYGLKVVETLPLRFTPPHSLGNAE